MLVVLLLASALISGAEVAFFSLTPAVFSQANESQAKRIGLIKKLLSHPKRLLATILVTNNFINIAIVLLFAHLSTTLLSGITNDLLKLFVEVVVITFIILLFGEILPKFMPIGTIFLFPHLWRELYTNLMPISYFFWTIPMSRFTLFIEKNLGQRSNSFSVDELSQALELTEQSDTTLEEDKILQGIVSFGNTETKQVMCPRVDVFALSIDLPLKDILPQIIDHGFSRIPVYRKGLDEIVGVLYSKDLMSNLDKSDFNWTKLLREPYIVPENKKLDDLLKEFQQKKIHIAIVVDEYGGTCGVVTLEDLIEEIVGDITDEFDDEDIEYSTIDANTYVFEAKVGLKDFIALPIVQP